MKKFIKNSLPVLLKGSSRYYLWLMLLMLFIISGILAYGEQSKHGLIVSAMRDAVPWGMYIASFTFLVGVAAASVLLVIPAYFYHFQPIKEIVLFGELIAVTAIIMCLLFITADLGKPLLFWHLIPIIGTINFPSSLLAWDFIVLNGYLILISSSVVYMLVRMYNGKEYEMSVLWPLVIASVPMALSIHTVTAFLYSGLVARPFWNASILAPRFIASALCSGPALMLIILQIKRKIANINISDAAIFKIAELIAYAIGFNLFLFGAEFFKEFYSGSIHKAPMEYLYFGLHGHTGLVIWMWSALTFNISAFIIFMIPSFRENFILLNIACVLIFIGVFIEKGMGLVIPGFIPGTLGEIYEYTPSLIEIRVSAGIWAFGAFIYTLFTRITLAIYSGKLREKSP